MTMLSKTTVLAAALIVGFSAAALANDREEEQGGFLLPGSMEGVNPVFHRDWFPDHAAQRAKAGTSLGHAAPHGAAAGAFDYVPRRPNTAQPLVAPAKEDNYGPQAGKD
jgi:hypothetical protein